MNTKPSLIATVSTRLNNTFGKKATFSKNTALVKKQLSASLLSALLASVAGHAQAAQLSEKEAHLIPIAALTASGDLTQLETALNEGLDAGLTVNEIKEVLVHSYPYTGFPRALNGINTFMSVMEERQNQGIVDIQGETASPMPEDFDVTAYGHQTRNALVGRDISNRDSGYAAFTPVIDEYLVDHLFGDVFYRNVLSHQERELATISMLSAMQGTEPQLRSHLGIAMRMGYDDEQITQFEDILRTQVSTVSADRAASTVLATTGDASAAAAIKAIDVTPKASAQAAPTSNFTGQVAIRERFASNVPDSYGGGIVDFSAGARTNWHTHPMGQTLVITEGTGWVQSEGESIREVNVGDVVWIPANERHWHGATPETAMSHVAVSQPLNGKTVEWMEAVTDAQYLGE